MNADLIAFARFAHRERASLVARIVESLLRDESLFPAPNEALDTVAIEATIRQASAEDIAGLALDAVLREVLDESEATRDPHRDLDRSVRDITRGRPVGAWLVVVRPTFGETTVFSSDNVDSTYARGLIAEADDAVREGLGRFQ